MAKYRCKVCENELVSYDAPEEGDTTYYMCVECDFYIGEFEIGKGIEAFGEEFDIEEIK